MMQLNNLAPSGQKPQKTISLRGGVELLSEDGTLVTVEELAADYTLNQKVAFSAPHGRIKFKNLRNLHPSDRTASFVTQLFLSDGQKITATEYDHYETVDGSHMQLNQLTEDDTLRVYYYDSAARFLQASIARIELITTTSLPDGTEFLYNAAFTSDACHPLISSKIETGIVGCLPYSCDSFHSDGKSRSAA